MGKAGERRLIYKNADFVGEGREKEYEALKQLRKKYGPLNDKKAKRYMKILKVLIDYYEGRVAVIEIGDEQMHDANFLIGTASLWITNELSQAW